MFSVVFDVSRWAFRRFIWFLVIVALLWAGYTIKGQLKGLADLEATLQYLKVGKSQLEGEAKALGEKAERSANSLTTAAVSQLDERIHLLEGEIEGKNQKLADLDGVLSKLNPATQVDVARLKIEIDLATQELQHLRYLKAIRVQVAGIAQLTQQCNKIRDRHVLEWNAYKVVAVRCSSLEASNDWPSRWNPFSDASQQLKSCEEERNWRSSNTRDLKAQHDQCLLNLERAKRNTGLVQNFVLKRNKTQAALADLQSQIDTMEEKVAKHWLKPILLDPLVQLVPTALGLLAGAIFVPFGIKLVLYFVLAPQAEKQSFICLQPNERLGESVRQTENKSEVSLAVEIAPDAELVVLPAYLGIAPNRCITRGRWVLNKRFVLTSLAAGMYNLTEVRADQSFTAKVSVGHEYFGELQRFEVGEGESVCLRPSNLVGIVQKRNSPVRVTSHWRLGSLQAWLTMQLRYLVFHGPATMLIKGGRGVRVEPADESSAIEQTSTLGFSAHLNYSTARTETFMAYIGGHKGLLRDRFSGRSGYFIYEEMPDPSRKAGISGKGLEGVLDTVLKIFGI